MFVILKLLKFMLKELVFMTAKNRVDVRISGKDYTLVGAESEEYIQRVALYIDRKMNEVTRMNSKLSTSLAAVLTAINVADDYFKIQESEANVKKELKRAQEELELLKKEKNQLTENNLTLSDDNTNLRLELAKREAELKEVRNILDKATNPDI